MSVRADDTPVALIRPIPDDRPRRARRPGGPSAPRPHRWRRWTARVVLGIVVLGVVYLAISFLQVWSTGRSDQSQPVDAIVVMGAAQYDGTPSPQLAARLDHVVELWPRGVAPLVVVTGGNRPGDRFTEAQASATYLEERGVPAPDIVLEDQGTTSYESLRNVADMLRERQLDDVLIVTDPYHALRSKLIAEEVGLRAHVSPTPTSVVTGGEQLTRQLQEAAGVAIGRIIGFSRI
ncbi:MAG: YdcF family protein [Ilumatobacteraceae bacterium]